MTTKLYPWTFEDSGVRISYRKVSYQLSADLRKSFPAPRPPKVTVQYEKGPVVEENPADPDYQDALAVYKVEFEARLKKLIAKRAVEYDLTEDDRKDVAKLRADMAELGVDLKDETDREVWLFRIAISTPQDYSDFVKAVTLRSAVTQEAKAEALASFRSDGSPS